MQTKHISYTALKYSERNDSTKLQVKSFSQKSLDKTPKEKSTQAVRIWNKYKALAAGQYQENNENQESNENTQEEHPVENKASTPKTIAIPRDSDPKQEMQSPSKSTRPKAPTRPKYVKTRQMSTGYNYGAQPQQTPSAPLPAVTAVPAPIRPSSGMSSIIDIYNQNKNKRAQMRSLSFKRPQTTTQSQTPP